MRTLYKKGVAALMRVDYSKVLRYYLILNRTCNMNCIYCIQNGLNKPSANIETFPSPKSIASYFPPSGSYEVIFYGGEALLYFDYMVEIARELKAYNADIKPVVTTNGSLLTPERADILNSLGFRVNISHDGPVYELTRRKPDILTTHADAICRLDNSVFVSTVTKYNWDYYKIWEHFESFVQKHGIKRRKVNMMFLKDAGGTTPEDLFIYKFKPFEDMLTKVHNNLKMHILNGVTDSYEFMAYKNTLGRILKEEKFHDSKTLCMHFDRSMVLDIYGNIYDCHNGRTPVANIRDLDIPDIINTRINEEPCKSCNIRNYCCGGCLKADDSRWKYVCYYLQHDFGGILRILNEIVDELNSKEEVLNDKIQTSF